jgi:hypothetical protein
MGRNEVDVLPLARQRVAEPTWIPGDWYLNQPPGYRLLFEMLFGRLIEAWGFLATSIVGRLMCYGLVALGLVLIGRKLGLTLLPLLLAVELLLYNQGVAASESLVGGLEAKSVAYSFVLLAIGLMLESRYCLMALMLGLATSFHVLVGGWTFLVVLGWLALRPRTGFKGNRHLGWLVLIYLVAGAFAIKPVLDQLFTPIPPSSISPSFIYVFLRLPHHLNPLSWSSEVWLALAIYLLVLTLNMKMLWQWRKSEELPGQYKARVELFEFTLISLVPFLLGLAFAPFDTQGSLLQFYPFRLGDVMLPLNTHLLLACTLQQGFAVAQTRRVLSLVCSGLLVLTCSIQAVDFQERFSALSQFPEVDLEVKALYDWVRTQTPTNTTVVSPPVELVNFTWLAERPTIAKYKLLPQHKAGILSWYERLGDLSGGAFSQPGNIRTQKRRNAIEDALTKNYNHLTTVQADALMTKYRAAYFMTRTEHQLDLPIAYHSPHYVLYSKKTLITNKDS